MNEKLPLYVGIIAIVIGLLAIGVAGQTMMVLSNSPAGHGHEKPVASEEDVDWLLEGAVNSINNDVVFETRTQGLMANVTILQETLQLHQDEIVKNKKLLQNAQIGTGDEQKDKLDEQSTTGDFGITINLAAKTFFRGDIIWVSGTSEALKPIEAIVLHPKIDPVDIMEKSYYTGPTANADKNGNYNLGFATDFDSRIGLYEVYVKSQGKTSDKLTFELVE